MKKSLVPVFVLLVFLFSCSKQSSENSASSKPQPAPSAKPVSAESENQYTGRVKIKTPDDQPVLELKFKGQEDVKLEYGSQVLRAKNKDGEKRKYEIDGNVVAEVKDGDDGFKLRTADGKLLWKVKFSDDKIKISNNEENQNPYELKIKGDDRVKVEKDNVELGEVKFYKDRQKVKVKVNEVEKYESNSDVYSAAYGVLVMPDIPEQQRNILIAELMMRKK